MGHFVPQPLQVMDPDHPLAALVRKAKQEQNGAAAAAAAAMVTRLEEVAEPAVTTTPAEYAADCEYTLFYFFNMYIQCPPKVLEQ